MTPEEAVRLDPRIGDVVREAQRRRAGGVPLNHAWSGGGRCAIGLKHLLAGLVGLGRREGPPELQTSQAYDVVADYVLGILERPAYLRPCPECGGPTWDNRKKKRLGQFRATGPDFKCKSQRCDGAVWPRKRS